jgi:hypothetical protein
MPRAQQIKITKDGQEGFCLKESLKAWERNGWTAADDGSSAEEEAVTEHPLETQAEESAPAKKTTTRKAAQ